MTAPARPAVCAAGCQLAAVIAGAEARRSTPAAPDTREGILERAGLVRVGSWCPCGGGHLLDDGDDVIVGAGYPLWVLPDDPQDAAFVRIAVEEGR